jgi:hypothetical protein
LVAGFNSNRLVHFPGYYAWILVSAVLVFVALALKCHEGYVEWTMSFAATVYRDFLILEGSPMAVSNPPAPVDKPPDVATSAA